MSRSEYDYRNAGDDYVFTVVVERGADGVKKAWQGSGSTTPPTRSCPA